MPQSLVVEGVIPLKPGTRTAVAELLQRFDGWIQWDVCELGEDDFRYAVEDIVTIGTHSDFYDFLDEVAKHFACAGWANISDFVTYYGPTEDSKFSVEIADAKRQLANASETLADTLRRASAS